MKHLSILVGFVCLIAMLLPTCAPAPEPEPEAAPEPVFDQEAEEAAIRQALEQRAAAFNAKDLKGFLATIAEDCTLDWDGGPCAGELRETGAFSEAQKNAQVKLLEETSVVFVTPDVAICRFTFEYSGELDADGKPLPAEKIRRARVYVKRNGKWLAAATFTRTVEE